MADKRHKKHEHHVRTEVEEEFKHAEKKVKNEAEHIGHDITAVEHRVMQRIDHSDIGQDIVRSAHQIGNILNGSNPYE